MDTEGSPPAVGSWQPSLVTRQLLDCSMDAVVMIDHDGTVLFWNSAAEALFGSSRRAAERRNLAELIIPARLRDKHAVGLIRAVHDPAGTFLGRRIEVTGQRRDGSGIPIELTVTRFDLDGHISFIGYLRDITAREVNAEALQASRRRLVNVYDDALRRIKRDLHDGAQQQLVAVAMCLSSAQQELDGDLHAAATWIDRANSQITDVVNGLRDLARGLHPEILTRRGLAGAIPQLARQSGIPVAAHNVTPVRLPPDIEVATFYVVAEALTNSAKHGARHATVDITLGPGTSQQPIDGYQRRVLVCVVQDDGPGGASVEAGTGLRGLVDRWAAVGGELTVDSPIGHGTRLTAVLHLKDDPDRV